MANASETAAKSAETASKQSETAAAGSASAAQQSASAAEESATAAAQSASAAEESATAAAQSAASIGNAEQVVTQKAEEASTSAANAAASAESAARSAEQAEEVAGGNFATKTEAQGYANTAESNAKAYTDQQISSIPTPDVSGQIGAHNTNTEAHNDIRKLITGLTNRLNALADSDDTTLDQLSEIVAYIKNNKTLIDGITTSKVNVTDIINNLTTNVTNKPLSAAQGVALKALIDAITVPKAEIFSVSLPASRWSNNVQTVSHAMLKAAGYGYIYNPDETSYGVYVSALVRCGDVATDGQVTFYCDETPTDDITVDFMRIEANENV